MGKAGREPAVPSFMARCRQVIKQLAADES